MESDDVKIEPETKTEILDEIRPDEPPKEETDENAEAVKRETEQVYFPECEESVVEEEICENDEFGEQEEFDGEEEIKLENPEEKPKLEPEMAEEKYSEGEQTNKQTILAERGTISQVEDMEIESEEVCDFTPVVQRSPSPPIRRTHSKHRERSRSHERKDGRKARSEENAFNRELSRNESFEKWKVSCRLLIPSKAAGSVIGKAGSTIKGLREEFGCSVMIPDSRGPERIITIKACDFKTSGHVVGRCAEHLDEFLRRNIPLRLLIPDSALRILPHDLESFCKERFKANVHIMNINCPFSADRIIQIGGDAGGKGMSVGHILEIVGTSNIEHSESNSYDPNKFEPDLDYGGFNRGSNHDEKKESDERPLYQPLEDDVAPNFVPMPKKGGDQLWIRKFVLAAKYFCYIVGHAGSRLEEIRRASGARIRYGAVQRETRLLAISGTQEQIDIAVYLIQNCVKRHID